MLSVIAQKHLVLAPNWESKEQVIIECFCMDKAGTCSLSTKFGGINPFTNPWFAACKEYALVSKVFSNKVVFFLFLTRVFCFSPTNKCVKLLFHVGAGALFT